MINRLIKAMVCCAVALFGLLAAGDNVIDYSTNFQFVQHVLSMDTIPDKRLIGRALRSRRCGGSAMPRSLSAKP